MSAIATEIPVVQISLCVPAVGEFSFKCPSEIPVNAHNIRPADVKIHPIVMNILISIAKDTAFHHGKAFPDGLRFRATLSQEKGVEIDDQRFANLIKISHDGLGCPVPVTTARNVGMMHVKQAVVSEQVRRAASVQLRAESIFFDPVSAMLFQAGQKEPLVVDLQIK